MMKRLLAGALALVFATAAFASDIPRNPIAYSAQAVSAPAVFGFYLGAQAGYGWGNYGPLRFTLCE